MTSYYRCETEEKNTKCLEQQVVLLRQSKRNADQSCVKLQADLRHSMAELQEMHQEFEVNKCTANACHGIFFFFFVFCVHPTLCLPASLCLPLSICLSILLSDGAHPSVCTVSHYSLRNFNVPLFIRAIKISFNFTMTCLFIRYATGMVTEERGQNISDPSNWFMNIRLNLASAYLAAG